MCAAIAPTANSTANLLMHRPFGKSRTYRSIGEDGGASPKLARSWNLLGRRLAVSGRAPTADRIDVTMEPKGTVVRLKRFDRARDFYERAERYLLSNEACHSLVLGLARQLFEYPGLYRERPYLATIEEDDRVVAASFLTPPHNPVLSLGFTPDSVLLVAEDLRRLYPTLPGVLGPVDAARSFA